MAYMDQTKKAAIAAALKPVVPAGWKYRLGVRNHMTIRMTITHAPIDLLGVLLELRRAWDGEEGERPTHWKVNEYYVVDHLRRAQQFELADVFEGIVAALDTGNHDRSDLMTDYHDVGHYIDLEVGRWDKPFVCTGPVAREVA